MGFVVGTLSNIAANLVFWILLGLAFWFAGLVSARRFVSFSGCAMAGRSRSISRICTRLVAPWVAELMGELFRYTNSVAPNQ
jgi:hypothetical protein